MVVERNFYRRDFCVATPTPLLSNAAPSVRKCHIPRVSRRLQCSHVPYATLHVGVDGQGHVPPLDIQRSPYCSAMTCSSATPLVDNSSNSEAGHYAHSISPRATAAVFLCNSFGCSRRTGGASCGFRRAESEEAKNLCATSEKGKTSGNFGS